MAAELENYQWELDDLVFGYDTPIEHEADSEPSSYSWRTQDQSNPGRDGKTMGRDLIEPGTWNFKLFTNTDSENDALQAMEMLATAWRGDAARENPNVVMPLRYRLSDRTRRVYGRPRRFTAPLGPEFHSGRIMITCDFDTVSELFFDDVEQAQDIKMKASTSGGVKLPTLMPFTTDSVTSTPNNTLVVGGRLPTPAVFEFHGPWSDAFIEIDGVRWVQLAGVVPFDQPVIVDARPWVMSVYRRDGSGAAGMLSRRTKLPGLLLRPGTHNVVIGGRDLSGNAFCRVRWRSAYPTV